MTTRIKNWKQFQHFKDRRPPWIKLYRDILDDIEWHNLDPSSAKILVMLWLIASESDGQLPSTPELAFRLRISESTIKSIILKLSHWLEHDDIATISEGYQNDLPEKRERHIKKDRVEGRKFIPPNEKDVVQYFVEQGYPEELGKRAFMSYSVADWHDSNGKPVKNWKQKMVNVWFKPENKTSGKGNGSTGIPRPSQNLHAFQQYLKEHKITGRPGEENELLYQRLLREARQ